MVEWSRLRNWENVADDFQTFEVILRDPAYYATPTGDGEIIFQYKRIVNDDSIKMYSTVGIEDHSETVGLEYTYANEYAAGAAPLAPGLAIKFTTEAPVYQAIQLSSFSVLAFAPRDWPRSAEISRDPPGVGGEGRAARRRPRPAERARESTRA